MSNVIVDREKIDILANAISDKSGAPVTMTLDEMVEAVDSIETGGGGITPTGNINITQAGVTDVTNYATATVPEAELQYGSLEDNIDISINSYGLINASYSNSISIDPTANSGWLEEGTRTIPVYIGLDGTYQLPTQSAITITPTESTQTAVTAGKYTTGAVTVNAIPSTYVGSGIMQRSSSDLTVSGATVTAPAGYYSAAAQKSVASGSASAPSSISGTSASVTTGTNTLTLTKTVSVTPVVSAGYVSSGTATNSSVSLTASIPVNPTVTASGATVTIPTGYYTTQTTKSVTTMTLPTAASSSATSGYTKEATISRSTSTQYINIAPGYNSAGGYYEISATPNGSATTPATTITANPTITISNSGLITATTSASQSVTPTVSAGYVSSGTAGTITVSGSKTQQLTTKAAATITPTTTNQTIAAGTYLTGTQTIAGDADLVASNIKKDVNIFGVTGTYDPTDFIINLTQDSNNKWIPDCTFAEAEAALNSGKALKFVAEYPAGDTYFGGYNDLDRTIAYGVVENTSTLSGTVLVDKSFIYDVANTVTQDLTSTYYTTTHATAQASDVISTKTFFNGSGYQTGTLDLTDVYIRSAAPTSSVGSDGDIYIQE